MHFVIPDYYIIRNCGWFAFRPCQDTIGSRLDNGVGVGLQESGMQVEYSEHIPSKGLVCVVTVKQSSPENYTAQFLSLATATVIPAYTTREYVLSYQIILDFKDIKEYQYNITEKALSSLFMWLLAPVVPFMNDVAIGVWHPGPLSPVVREATKRFWQDAHRDGIF